MTINATSTSYLSFILETARHEKWVQDSYYEEIKEYVFRDNGVCRWTILVDASEISPDYIPVLISEGIDLQYLEQFLATEGGYGGGRTAKVGTGVVSLKNGKNILITPTCPEPT